MKRSHGDIGFRTAGLDFSGNIPPFEPPAGVLEILKKSWRKVAAYPSADAAPLCAAAAAHHGIPAESVLAGNGSSDLIYLLAKYFSGERARIPLPAFTEYEDACEAFGIPVNGGGETVTFLGNPNNPDGKLRSRAEILSFPATVVVDEAFMPFTDEKESLVAEAAGNPRVIAVRSLTKIYSLPGLRIGYLVAHPDTVRRLKKLVPPWNCNSLAIEAGIAALRDREHVARGRTAIQTEREFFFSALNDLGLKPLPSAVNFILCKVSNAAALCRQLAEQKIFIRNCDSFTGLAKNRFIRIAVRTRKDNEPLIAALKEILLAGKI